jgi:CheY-like chemotaxis protein
MAKPLRVLLAEDSERDEALLKLYLRRGGYDVELQRVDTLAALDAQLRAGAWDVAISDFNLPGFDAFAARKAVLQSGREIPFLVLSGDYSPALRETLDAEGIRYLTKSEIRNIVPVIDELLRNRP